MFATGVVYTGGKFADGIVGTGGARWLANISVNFQKNLNGLNGIIRGWGETDSWKKNRSKKSRDTVPLITAVVQQGSISQATVGAASRSRRYCTVHSTTVQYYVNITLDLGDVTSWLG